MQLLQQLLSRSPRANMSPGIMADLTAALNKLEKLGPVQWEQQEQQQEQLQQQQLLQQQQQQYGLKAADAADGGDLDLDALIDKARSDLSVVAAVKHPQQVQLDSDGFALLSGGFDAAADAELDGDAKQRIATRLAIVEELLRESS
jgi:hypothetical protein